MSRSPVNLIVAAALLSASFVFAEMPDPDPSRFAKAMQKFAIADREKPPPQNANLFVGSSSIRKWSIDAAFPDHVVINRGFGGSELSDVVYYYDHVIKPYAPSRVFIYGGDNDIARGKGADQVFDDYKALVERLRSDFPAAEVVFLSIKPSRARWGRWPTMKEVNRRIREYSERDSQLSYVDVASPLLNLFGRPGPFFVDDGLHLNSNGYERWQQALQAHLSP